MPKKILINNVEYVPASQAGKLVGYTPDYISKLAREEKIRATRSGRHWYVDLVSLEAFKAETEAVKQQRAKQIREERKLEQKIHQSQQSVAVGAPLFALGQTAVVVLLGFWVGMGGYFFTSSGENLEAQISRTTFERLAITVYELFSPEETLKESRISVELEEEPTYEITEADTSTTTYTSLLVAPEELFTESQVAEIRDSFSDEVEVSIDPEHPDTGVITPIFRDRNGESYRFLMMPVRPSQPSDS